MDPVDALTGTPRKAGAPPDSAPDAATWLANPTKYTATPTPLQLLLQLGQVLDEPAADHADLISSLQKAIAP